MRAKKAKGKRKTAVKISAAKEATAKKSKPRAKKPVEMEQVRENISNLVRKSASKIAIEVIKVALTGQLATAKYLFEAVGLYPATEQTEARPIETTMAHQLLTRMGLPLEPVVYEQDGETMGLEDEAKDVSSDPGSRRLTVVAEEEREAEAESVSGENEE